MLKSNQSSSPTRLSKTPQRRMLKKTLESNCDASVLLLHYGVALSPHRRRHNNHLNRGRNLSSKMKSYRAHRSTSPSMEIRKDLKHNKRKIDFEYNSSSSNAINQTRQNMNSRSVIGYCDEKGKHGNDYTHISPAKSDLILQDYVQQGHGTTDDYLSTPEQTETREELILRLENAHMREIVELKNEHQQFVDRMRESYHVREKNKDSTLRQLDHDIKKLRQEMDLMKLSYQQSLDSVRTSIESQCKALLSYVQNEIEESKHETQIECDVVANTTPSVSPLCLQNDDSQVIVLHQSPVPTLQSWQCFTRQFRKAISGEDKISENRDETVVVNTKLFVEELSFSSLEKYYDAECSIN